MKKQPIAPIPKHDHPSTKDWENPSNPEKSGDHRELEKLERAKKEADRRNNNLTEDDN